jgi:hypothetical protein
MFLTLGVPCHTKDDVLIPGAWLWGSNQDRVIGVSFDMLLQILGTFECLPTEVAFMRLQGHMDPNVRRDVIALDSCGPAASPLAGQVEIVCALAANMALTDMFLMSVSLNSMESCTQQE